MLDALILRKRRIDIVRLFFLSALLVLSGCSTQSPSGSVEEPRDIPDRIGMAAEYFEVHAGDALVVWDEPQKIPLRPIVEK